MINTNNLVKKRHSYLVLCFAWLLCMPLHAEVANFVGGYGALGEWSLKPMSSKNPLSLGVTGNLGVVYELQVSQRYSPTAFLANVGLGVSAGSTTFIKGVTFRDTLYAQTGLDGETFDYVYQVNDRRDVYNNVALQIPILIGVQHNKFYLLGGLKINYSLLTKAVTRANVSTYGHYTDIPDLMPDADTERYQFFTERSKRTSNDASFNLDMDLSLEIGGRLNSVTSHTGFDVPKHKIEYRLAGFVDIGLLDIHVKGNNSLINKAPGYDINPSSQDYVYNSTSMLDKMSFNPLMSTSGFAKEVRSAVIGVKFTMLFRLQERKAGVYYWGNERSTGARGLQFYE